MTLRTRLPQLSLALTLLVGCQVEGDSKIRLAQDGTGGVSAVQVASSVLTVRPEQQRTLGIRDFRNDTGDEKLDWLERGLTEMLMAELRQSATLTVIPLSRRGDAVPGFDEDESDPLGRVSGVSSREPVGLVLSGRLYREDQGLNAEATLRDAESGQTLRHEVVTGPGIESMLQMAGELATRLQAALREDLGDTGGGVVTTTAMPSSVEAFRYFSEGMERQHMLFSAEAEALYGKAIDLDPGFARAYLYRAMLRYRLGRPDLSAEDFAQAEKNADKLTGSDLLLLKLSRAQMDNDAELVQEVRQELRRQAPYDKEIRDLLARTLYSMHEYDQALEEYEALKELDPTRKLTYNMLGYLHGQRGDLITALRYLDKYEKLAPGEPNPHDSRGEVLMLAGRLEEAAEPLQMALQLRPDFYHSARRLGDLFGELGDLDRALEYNEVWLDSVSERYPQASAHLQRAMLFWRFGLLDEAEQELRTARELAPGAARPVLLSGEFYASRGKQEVARELYRSFLTRLLNSSGRNEWSSERILGILAFSLTMDLPPAELAGMLEQLSEGEERKLVAELYRLYRGVLLLRAGKRQEAQSCLGKAAPELEAAMNWAPREGLRAVWRTVTETLHRAPDMPWLQPLLSEHLVERARKARRTDMALLLRLLRAQDLGEQGETRKMRRGFQELGLPLEDDWRVIGPFPDTSPFHTVFPPEAGEEGVTDYTAAGGRSQWRPAGDGIQDGYVDLRSLLGPTQFAAAYAEVHVKSPERRVVQVRLGADEGRKLWLNGELMWQSFRRDGHIMDQDIIKVVLRPGDNRLLLKLTTSAGGWGYWLRLTDGDGEGFEDLSFQPASGAARTGSRTSRH